jgi:hypothetical protein
VGRLIVRHKDGSIDPSIERREGIYKPTQNWTLPGITSFRDVIISALLTQVCMVSIYV